MDKQDRQLICTQQYYPSSSTFASASETCLHHQCLYVALAQELSNLAKLRKLSDKCGEFRLTEAFLCPALSKNRFVVGRRCIDRRFVFEALNSHRFTQSPKRVPHNEISYSDESSFVANPSETCNRIVSPPTVAPAAVIASSASLASAKRADTL